MALSSMQIGYVDLRQFIDLRPPAFSTQEYQAKKMQGELETTQVVQQKPSSRSVSQGDMDLDALDDEVEQEGKAQPSKSKLEPVTEVLDFNDNFELDDDAAWDSIPKAHISGRFKQYRKLSKTKIQELEHELEVTIHKTKRKVDILKGQFHEHKKRWELERELLVQQVEQAVILRSEAEKEADHAIDQLEDFITEQEQLEMDEERKRKELEAQIREPTLDVNAAEAQLATEVQNTLVQSIKGSSMQSLIEHDDEELVNLDSRISSAVSRGSAADRRRSSLNHLRKSAEARRSKSPLNSSLPPSRLQNMEVDENGDMPFPDEVIRIGPSLRDISTSVSVPSVYDAATSDKAPSMYDATTSVMDMIHDDITVFDMEIADHPIVQEFLKAYRKAVTFKDNLSSLFMDKDMTSLSQVLTDIEDVPFNRDITVLPQVEEMSNNLMTILDEILQIIKTVMANDRDYPVSSLISMSRDPTRSVMLTREKTQSLMDILPQLATHKPASASSTSSTKDKLEELQQQYLMLQSELREQKLKYEEEIQHNTVVMLEMQDTIHTLQQELAALKQAHAEAQNKPKSPTIMFTRADARRNSRTMKKAVMEGRLESAKYENATEAMERYVDVSAKRLVNLVNKYAHHHQMTKIEESLQQSSVIDSEVLQLLDRMETVQNERAQRWADEMDNLAHSRQEIANYLMVTLDEIEQDSGIFLIKPILSYTSPPSQEQNFKSKTSRNFKTSHVASSSRHSVVRPIPTPLSPKRTSAKQSQVPQVVQPDDPAKGVNGKQSTLLGAASASQLTWKPATSKAFLDINDKLVSQVLLETPKILELDVNRMLISQNQVSMSIEAKSPSNDRLANAANQSTRTYATLTRATGSDPGLDKTRTGIAGYESSAPPTTPLIEKTTSFGITSPQLNSKNRTPSPINYVSSPTSRNIPATPPLPPISPTAC